MAEKFDLKEVKVTDTPCPATRLTPATSADEVLDPLRGYSQMVGSLMYLMITCRPDIAYAVNQLSRFIMAPTKSHILAAKRCIVYCLNTASKGLVYRADRKHQQDLVCYTDSDFMSALNSAKKLRTVG